MTDTQAHHGSRYIETSDRGILRRLDESELSASATEIPGISANFTVLGQSPQASSPVASSSSRSRYARARRREKMVTFTLRACAVIAVVALTFLVFT